MRSWTPRLAIGIPPATLHGLQKDGKYPPLLKKYGKKASGMWSDEVERMNIALTSGLTDDQIHSVVAKIETERLEAVEMLLEEVAV